MCICVLKDTHVIEIMWHSRDDEELDLVDECNINGSYPEDAGNSHQKKNNEEKGIKDNFMCHGGEIFLLSNEKGSFS